MASVEAQSRPQVGWLDRLLATGVRVDAETVAYTALILIAVFTRFYDLGARVMSHDESLHTYYSFQLAEGHGFQHTPLMHGPLQFHLIALSYFIFGDSDASARFPAAFAGVLAVGILYFYRRWLGKLGAFLAALMMTFSPYILYHSRYARNESLIVPLALIAVYAVIRYFEERRDRWLYVFLAALSLHFTSKETAFIYTAQLLLFLAGLFAWRILRATWEEPRHKFIFQVGLASGVLGVFVAFLALFRGGSAATLAQGETLQPLDPTAGVASGLFEITPLVALGMLLAVAGMLLAGAAIGLAYGRRLRTEFPAFDLLVVTGTMTLPMLAAFPANLLGWDPLAYQDPALVTKTAIVVVVLVLLAVGIGLAWDWRRWLICAAVFYGIFTVFYTTLFTYGFGFFTGLVGSLGYWLDQHSVRRGSQPWYYYLLIQVPVYEYFPALGALLAGYYGLRKWWTRGGEKSSEEVEAPEAAPPLVRTFPVLPFIGFWAVTALIAYSFAGERMPWLTVHITLPLILLGGWAFGTFLGSVDWSPFKESRGWLIASLVLLAVLAVARTLGSLLGTEPPFGGAQLDQLEATMNFLTSLAVAVASILGLYLLARGWRLARFLQLAGAALIGILFALTVRTALRAAFINYDQAREFLVYAHAATGVKTVMRQVEDLSYRTTDGLNIDLGYDDDVSWPFSWYLRNYTHAHYFAQNPTRELLNYPVLIVGDNNWGKVEPILGNRYYSFQYIRMWWPMQEYFGLTWDRIWNAISSPDYRAALWEMWLNRDYTRYGELTNKDFSLENWSPSDLMRLYVRKDIASLIWDYGVSPVALEPVSLEDPYEKGMTQLAAERTVGSAQVGATPLQGPRDVAVAPDGSLFVADTGNSRILHLSAEGALLNSWGQFADLAAGAAPGGTFNQPWGLGAAPDGSLYVADTWNHRVQHFSPDGTFLGMFGYFGQAETPDAFWGPRDVAVDAQGRVFVADTGNKRVAIFDADGSPLGSFGSIGVGPGQLDEPVGLAIASDGRVVVADTWNQRVQVFEPLGDMTYDFAKEWPIEGWYGQSLDNKPYLAVSPAGAACTSDPEQARILCFNLEGEFTLGWGQPGTGPSELTLPTGMAFDADGKIWVADSGNNRIVLFAPSFP